MTGQELFFHPIIYCLIFCWPQLDAPQHSIRHHSLSMSGTHHDKDQMDYVTKEHTDKVEERLSWPSPEGSVAKACGTDTLALSYIWDA